MDAPKDENHSHRKWSNLLDELLHKIWQQHVDPQLQTDVRRRLRAVCTSWRASVPLTITTPNQRVNVPNSFDASLSETAFYLVENIFYLITPLENPKAVWLVRAEERGQNLYRMRNPFCGSYCLFYMYHPFCITSKIDNLLNYQIREVYRSYTVKRSYRSLPHVLFQLEPSLQKPLRKVVTSNVINFTPFTALGLTCTGFLVFWRQGDTKWTKLVKFRDETHKDRLVETVSNDDEIGDDDKSAFFIDIAVHKGKFYAVEMERDNIYEIDLVSMAANDIRPFTVEVRTCFSSSQSPATQFMIDDRGCYLSNCSFVECKGLLYYINHDRHQSNNQCETKRLYVLKDDKNGSEWESVGGLEAMADQVIFLLGEASFVVPEADGLGKAGVLSTSKYVPDNLMHKYGQVHMPFEGCFQKCTFRKAEDDGDDKEVASTSLSRDDDCNSIFFPPPPWLKSYYKTQWDNAPLKFTELFDSSF